MNKIKNLELNDIFDKVILKLQKRDELRVNSTRTIKIDGEYFSEFEIAYYIAEIYGHQHSIPMNYLCYYIKPSKRLKLNKNLSVERNQIIKKELAGRKITKRLLAGGSLAKTYLGEDKDKNTVVIKSASGWPSKKLINEISYLDYLFGLPKLSMHIPETIDKEISDDSATLILRYYPYNTLSYNILFSVFGTEKAWKLTKKVLDFVSKDIWSKKEETTPDNYVETFFLDRIENNISKMVSQSPRFKNVVEKEFITINGHKYDNLLEIVKKIRNNRSLIERVTPPSIRTIWGDLHPNNILVNKNEFVLIDPRGDLGDYLYDLGKIYHTYGPGRYDYIDNDLFVVKVTIGSSVNIKRQFYVKHPSWKVYNELRLLFQKDLPKYIDNTDKNWRIRWEFLKFCIYATMPLFLIKNDNIESRALMGYSNAVILGNKFLKYLKKHEYQNEI